MTSEVLILNKHAAVLAADSAMTTTGNGDHPRYSKSANKLFELANVGNVGVAIFQGAALDGVPWEVLLKMFRKDFGKRQLPAAANYVDALLSYVQSKTELFTDDLRHTSHFHQFLSALTQVTSLFSAEITDSGRTEEERRRAWLAFYQALRTQLMTEGIRSPLTQNGYDAAISTSNPIWEGLLQKQIESNSAWKFINAKELAEVVQLFRFTRPGNCATYTGVVVVGFGTEEFFPAYRQVKVFGFFDEELYWEEVQSEAITHDCHSIIRPLAQTSMIDMFTDGYSFSAWKIIGAAASDAFWNVLSSAESEGTPLAPTVKQSIVETTQRSFMDRWTNENFQANYQPLASVLATLSVEEMAHLAETLLTLQSLKERVTSPSESVGGPIDLAAITKAEGMVWLKRKFFFKSELNPRYCARTQANL